MKIAFLHTADVHVVTFDRLLSDRAPGTQRVHAVRPEWLKQARERGLDESLIRNVSAHLTSAAEAADVVICTCSTLGPIVSKLALARVVRVDEPMMDASVACDGRVLLALCLESTRQASSDLLAAAFVRAGKPVDYEVVLCADAWPMFEAGNLERFGESIAASVARTVACSVNATHAFGSVALGQASMAVAQNYLAALAFPVFASPMLAVERALQLGDTQIRD